MIATDGRDFAMCQLLEGRMSKRTQITHSDIQRALMKFMGEGGLIRKLPDAPDVRSARVYERHSVTRDLIERIRAAGYVESAE